MAPDAAPPDGARAVGTRVDAIAEWARFVRAIAPRSLRLGGVLVERAARQFARLPRTLVGGLEFHHDETGTIVDIEAVVGVGEHSPLLPASVRDQATTLARDVLFKGRHDARLENPRDDERRFDVLGDVWFEASETPARDHAVLVRRRTGSDAGAWASAVATVLEARNVGAMDPSLLRSASLVGAMPGRIVDTRHPDAVRLLFSGASTETLSRVLALAEAHDAKTGEVRAWVAEWGSSAGRYNLALDLRGAAVRWSGVEIYPADAARGRAWNAVTSELVNRCGWTMVEGATMAAWAARWSSERVLRDAPSHLAGVIAASSLVGDGECELELRVSPSHAKVMPSSMGSWSAKTYLRFELAPVG